MALHCPDCDEAVVGYPHGFTTSWNPEEGPPARYTLLQCPKGHSMLVVQEEYGGGHKFDDEAPYRLYPAQDRHLSRDIPEELRAAHDEARRCFHAKAYVACVVMCGRTIEAVCKLHGVNDQGLHKKLIKMEQQGYIDGRLKAWADILKTVRNAAAHADNADVSRQDAEDALAYNEALLDYLYVMKARFDALVARRAPAPGSGT